MTPRVMGTGAIASPAFGRGHDHHVCCPHLSKEMLSETGVRDSADSPALFRTTRAGAQPGDGES